MATPQVTLPFTLWEVITLFARGVWSARAIAIPGFCLWLLAMLLRRFAGGRRKARSTRARKAAATQAHADHLQQMVDAPATDGPSWRDDPATSKQRSFADSLGVVYPASISKGELSDLIEQAKRTRD